ncbi:uroporphyrinogen decarboxylase family protein [Chloroflexota bacterium]
MTKTPAEMLAERTRRLDDVIALKVPDRVPFIVSFQFFPAYYAEYTVREVMYDYEKALTAWKKIQIDLEPDAYDSPWAIKTIGPTLELLDYRQMKWPGHGLGDNDLYQFMDDEQMPADEYDDFLFDPSGYMLRCFLPRVSGAFAPLKDLPPLTWFYYTKIAGATAAFGQPEIKKAVETLIAAGAEEQKKLRFAKRYHQEMQELGFPAFSASMAYAPYDYLGNLMRGAMGIMLDMYRLPDKLLEALDKLLKIVAEEAIYHCKTSGINRVFMPLHKGADGFMSASQFNKFYWPTLKKLMLKFIDDGITPCPFFEGAFDTRLEIIGDIPRGKAIYWFSHTDIAEAKEVLGDTVCLRGGVPSSLLSIGTPDDVKVHCKKLIDTVGKNGGFIMDADAAIAQPVKTENLFAMAEFTRSYGVYG